VLSFFRWNFEERKTWRVSSVLMFLVCSALEIISSIDTVQSPPLRGMGGNDYHDCKISFEQINMHGKQKRQ